MAALTLYSLFSNEAVLQRDMPLPIWGTASPGAAVTVSLAGQSQSAKAGDDGRWRVTLDPLPAGGPHTLTVQSGGESLTRTSLFIGEVWLCAGQSNMQWTVAQCVDAEAEAAAAANFPRLRLFQVPKNGTPEPQAEFTGPAAWQPCAPDKVRNFSSLAYLFGRELHGAPSLNGVAIGLIDCSFGGTKVEAWMSRVWLDAHFPGEPLRDSIFGFKPTAMFNAMIAPLAPYPVRGVLWYQGESNASHPAQYGRLLPGMIAEWRERWRQPAMPFFLVQLPNWSERIEAYHFTWVREQQARVAAADPNVHMAVAIDAGDDYDLHPLDKRPVANRLARLARAKIYGDAIAADSPAYQSHEITTGTVHVRFAHTGGGLVHANAPGPLRGFAIAGEDGQFYYAEAEIEGAGSVVLRHPAVPAPRHVRYAMEGAPAGADLFNDSGLPAAPFRTDDFPPDTADLFRLPQPHMFRSPIYEALIDGGACMTSLRVRGMEFIDSTDPFIPGTFFKSAFGAVRLHHISVDGPRVMRAEMYSASIRFEFRDDGMTWLVENLLDQEMPFCMILSSKIESAQIAGQAAAMPMPAEGEFSAITLRRGDAALEISGAGGRLKKAFSEPSPVPAIEWTFKPNESKTIGFKMK